MWISLLIWIFIGHFYCALFILWSASVFYKEVISMSRVLRKDQEIAFSWMDWYWYAVGAYICIPYAFLRRAIIRSLNIESKSIFYIGYMYHSLISQILVMIGTFLTVIKLNRGFVKYQLRRTLWSAVTLGYVFMLSTVQIYNLYQGYIWMVHPLLCVRANAWFAKYIHQNNKTREPPIHKYLPNHDPTSLLIAFILTGVFAFISAGHMSQYQHLVCKQDELSLRMFEAKTCTVNEIFEAKPYFFSS